MEQVQNTVDTETQATDGRQTSCEETMEVRHGGDWNMKGVAQYIERFSASSLYPPVQVSVGKGNNMEA